MNQDIIIYAIATIILVGSWVANILRKQSEERREKDKATRTGSAANDSKPSLDELAARRREELRAMARQRGETQAKPINRPGAGEPANLSMAERIARARAKAQYEERAKQLGKPTTTATTPRPQPTPTRAEPRNTATEMERARQREAQRRQTEARQRQEAERRANAEKQRRARQREQERQRARQVAEQQRKLAEQQARRTREQTRKQTTSADRRQQRSTAASAYAIDTTAQARSLVFNRQSLRQAVILRELFDRPLAVRDSLNQGDF